MNKSYGVSINERAFQFGKSVIFFSRALWKTYEGRIIANQLIRSATSIGANIAEGQDASSKRQFLQYLQISLRSAKETQFWLRLASEINNERNANIGELQKEVGEIVAILVASVLRLKGSKSQ